MVDTKNINRNQEPKWRPVSTKKSKDALSSTNFKGNILLPRITVYVTHSIVTSSPNVVPRDLTQNPREDQQDPQVSLADLRSSRPQQGLRVEQLQSPVRQSRPLDSTHYRLKLLLCLIVRSLRRSCRHFLAVHIRHLVKARFTKSAWNLNDSSQNKIYARRTYSNERQKRNKHCL